ncbi:lactate utilization protein [Clostridiaceae bacterium M8S5]|nr:lactate utilization protein [Clostridiaceae bacterium M8S5]
MDDNMKFVNQCRAKKTIENLAKGNINGYLVEDGNDAIEIIEKILKEGDTVTAGGSITLKETGVMDYLRKGRYNFLDREVKGLTAEDKKEIYRKAFFADGYLTSANALTTKGEIYNVDGNGNRVAATIFGPDKVIFVVGVNKLVDTMQEAINRNAKIAAPANAKRIDKQTPCTKVGECVDCLSKDRICRKYVVIKGDYDKDRIHVIIVNQNLGY